MSENLDLVRSIFAAWERGDYGSAEWADPEIEFVIADGPSPGRWTGLAGMAEGWRDVAGSLGRVPFRRRTNYRVLDDERVLVLFRPSGRGKTSGLDLAQMQTAGAACSTSETAR